MDSMMTEPPMSDGTDRPRMVMTGMSALRRACLNSTTWLGNPLARAVMM